METQYQMCGAPSTTFSIALTNPDLRPTQNALQRFPCRNIQTSSVLAKMFDEDNSGKIDEDEFFFLLQFLGIEVGGVDRSSRSS